MYFQAASHCQYCHTDWETNKIFSRQFCLCLLCCELLTLICSFCSVFRQEKRFLLSHSVMFATSFCYKGFVVRPVATDYINVAKILYPPFVILEILLNSTYYKFFIHFILAKLAISKDMYSSA